MASDTGTAIANNAPAAAAPPATATSATATSATANPATATPDSPRAAGVAAGAPTRHQRGRRISPLTLRILAVNVLALALLGIGLLFLGEYESSLIDTELQAFKTQGEIFAAERGEGAVIDSVA